MHSPQHVLLDSDIKDGPKTIPHLHLNMMKYVTTQHDECVPVQKIVWRLTARQHRKVNLCQLQEGETDSGG